MHLAEQLEDLQLAFEEDVDRLDDAYDAQGEELTEILIRPKSTEIDIRFVSIGWVPLIEERL